MMMKLSNVTKKRESLTLTALVEISYQAIVILSLIDYMKLMQPKKQSLSIRTLDNIART